MARKILANVLHVSMCGHIDVATKYEQVLNKLADLSYHGG